MSARAIRDNALAASPGRITRMSREEVLGLLNAAGPKRSKYRVDNSEAGKLARTVGGVLFASLAEARRYGQLKLLERAGHIRQLELQPEYPVVIENKRICVYRADFRYFEGGLRVVEDCKGVATPVYRLKKKLVEALYPGVTIREVRS